MGIRSFQNKVPSQGERVMIGMQTMVMDDA